MIEKGVVARIKGDRALILVKRRGECDKCHACKVAKDGMNVQIVVKNTLGANVGDSVEIDTGKKSLQVASACLYLIPLVMVAIAVGVGTLFAPLAQLILGLSALGAGMAIALFVDFLGVRKRKGFAPRMKAVIVQYGNIRQR